MFGYKKGSKTAPRKNVAISNYYLTTPMQIYKVFILVDNKLA